MKAHMIRVASGGSKSWGKHFRRGFFDEDGLGFTLAREEGPAWLGRRWKRPWTTDFWWAGTNLDGRAN